MDFDFHPEAEQEYLEAVRSYDAARSDLGDRFVAEVELAIRRVLRNPLWFKKVSRRVRRCLTRTFPYGLLYAVERERVLIVAVMHLHRKPGYWKRRIGRP